MISILCKKIFLSVIESSFKSFKSLCLVSLDIRPIARIILLEGAQLSKHQLAGWSDVPQWCLKCIEFHGLC